MTRAPILYWRQRSPDPPTGVKPRVSLRDQFGPGEGRGLLYSMFEVPRIEYDPDVQRWDEAGGGLWIGAALDAEPEEFHRGDIGVIPEYWVTLGDGNRWQVPIANPEADSCSLPMVDVLRRGVWTNEVVDQYIGLADRCRDLHVVIVDALMKAKTAGEDVDADIDFPDGKLRELAVDVLATVYELTVQEMSVLRLFTKGSYWKIAEAFMDIPALIDIVNRLEVGTTDLNPLEVARDCDSSEHGDKVAGVTIK